MTFTKGWNTARTAKNGPGAMRATMPVTLRLIQHGRGNFSYDARRKSHRQGAGETVDNQGPGAGAGRQAQSAQGKTKERQDTAKMDIPQALHFRGGVLRRQRQAVAQKQKPPRWQLSNGRRGGAAVGSVAGPSAGSGESECSENGKPLNH